MLHVTPYLGLDKYIVLLTMTRNYHESEGGTGEAKPIFTEGGSRIVGAVTHEWDKNHMDSTADIEGREKLKEEQVLISMKNLEDSLANELFVSVINLMKFMCLEALLDINDYFD